MQTDLPRVHTTNSVANPRRMRAVRLDGPGLSPRSEWLPVPRPRSGEALLRVLAAGVCHTDLQLLDGTLNPGVWPLTPGHEIVGEVIEGPRSLHGRRVLVHYSRPCGECDWCSHGQEQVCPNAGPQVGISTDGGFAEMVCAPVDCLVPLPDHLDAAEAAPLGCAAASAYHALHGIATVCAGQSVVVYGIGGVGLALIQLAVLAGTRVLAIGRSPAKLALAASLGAEVVDARTADPLIEVRRRTRGEGVHVVFELVGSAATLAAAVAMPRRQGRVVCVGYSDARLQLNPLHLVLRETRLLGALGNTRAELKEVVRLAAAGALRIPVAERFALEDTDLALDALRAGALVGRAVVMPSARAAARRRSNATQPQPQSQPPPQPTPATRSRAPTPLALPSASERPRAATDDRDVVPAAQFTPVASSASEPARRPLEAELLAFVGRGIDAAADYAAFNDLALRLFAYQFANTRPYRLLAQRRGRTPSTVAHWRHLPAVPIAAFKATLLAAEPLEGATEFNSSGTTNADRKSRHFHPSLELYNLNARLNFKAHVLPERDTLRLLVLFPPRHELPHSSLAHWLTLMVETFGAPGSGWFVDNSDGLDAARLLGTLRVAAADGEPVGVLAASFGLVHFLEHCQATGERLRLPPGSRVMDTGGYKGRSREYAKAELYGMVTDLLGVPPTHIVNMYGMTEHGTQFLDAVLLEHLSHPTAQPRRYKVVPPWARTLVVDPHTLAELPAGERGLLLHIDLINRASALAVLSEDVGQRLDVGFELAGRAEGSEARGCSIALDELLEAAHGGRR